MRQILDNNMIIFGASEIVTCSGFEGKKGKEMSNLSIIHDKSIVVDSGIIKAIISNEEALKLKEDSQYKWVDASGKCVMPGFVDSHTHLVFGGSREEEYSWRLRGDSYMTIMENGGGIVNSVEGTKNASYEELVKLGIHRLNSMTSLGVTTVEGKSGYGLDKDTELKQLRVMKELNEIHSLDIIPTFLGPHAVPKDAKGKEDAFIEFMINEVLPIVEEENLAVFADIFCEDKVFSVEQSRKFLQAAKDRGFKLKIHADEIVQLGGAELAASLGATSADHLLQASDQGIKDLASQNVVATLLPCTAFSLKEHYARGREMIDQGCIVALATDFNPGSCFTESIPLLIALSTLYMKLSTEETITALTINGAAALDMADTIGSIDVGKKADIVIHEFPSYKFLPYHIGMSTAERIIKNGRLILDKRIEKPL